MDSRPTHRIQNLSQQSQTRILQSSHTQNLRLNFTQSKFPSSIMDGFVEESGDEGDPADLIKKRFEKLSFSSGIGGGNSGDGNDEMSLCTTTMPMTMTMPTMQGFDDSGFGSRIQEMGFNKLLGASGMMMADHGVAVTAMRSEKAQVFAASRSSTIQSSQGSISSSSMGPQMHMPSSSSMNNSSWMNMNMNLQSGLKQEMAATMSGLKHSSTTNSASSVSAAAIQHSATAGVTRSFSSSSGFPIPPSSSIFSQQQNNVSLTDDDRIIPNASRINNSEIPSLNMNSFVSPFRRPFGFRNFDRPLFTDMSANLMDNRMTWDPSTIQAMKSSTSQLQFSASQRTVFQSVNGSFRAYKDQKVSLRQSYGASESESEDEDDDDDDDDDIKQLTYETRKALPYVPKLAICDKPEYPPSESDDTSVITLEPDDQSPTSPPVTPEHRRCHKVAQELLTTERTYVRILHLIDQVFHFRVDQENRVNPMFTPDTVTQMFGNIKSLYALHSNHLLPQLEKRLSEWKEDDPKIGDVMKEFSPFLKMYSEYVQNFDNAINLINVYKEKNSRFANIINEIQKSEQCSNLPIQHHLIGPIQRIPRYRLLLEAYLRKLPETSSDREDTQKALDIVSKAAEHANEAMRRIVSFKKLLEVQEQIKGAVDLVSPTRTLIKEGPIKKISARTSDHQDRYLFLFSDMVLLCSLRPMANMISSAPYQLRAKLDIAAITVSEGDDLEITNTFYIQDQSKRIELYTPTTEDKKSWMEQMWQARIDLLERKSSLRLGSVSPSEDLGMKEPVKLKTDNVAKCMELSCGQPFTIFKKKKNCGACGAVVCAKCCAVKVPLPYAGTKLCRVCKSCKSILEERGSAAKKNGNSSSPPSPDEPLERVKGVLDVPASSASVVSGYLSLRLRGKKEWTSRWFALRRDFVLYCYATDTDAQAMTATPIPGMDCRMADQLPKSETTNLSNAEKLRAFRIAHEHGRKVFLFLAETREEAIKFVNVLQAASKAELHPGVNGNETNQQP